MLFTASIAISGGRDIYKKKCGSETDQFILSHSGLKTTKLRQVPSTAPRQATRYSAEGGFEGCLANERERSVQVEWGDWYCVMTPCNVTHQAAARHVLHSWQYIKRMHETNQTHYWALCNTLRYRRQPTEPSPKACEPEALARDSAGYVGWQDPRQ